MRKLHYITPYTSLTDEHFRDIRMSVDLGYGTFGAIEALKHCEVVSIWIEDDEPFERLDKIFMKNGYTLLEDFDTSVLTKH